MDIFSKLNIKTQFEEEKIKIKDELKSIYIKPHKERTHHDYDILYDNLKNLSFFKKLESKNLYGDLMYKTFIRRMEIKDLRQ